MADAEQTAATPATPTTPKKAAKSKAAAAKKLRAAPSHPKTADMVNAAIRDLKERGGSSLHAIKKYIAANYKVNADKLAPLIRKYLNSAVTSGLLVQTKGKGASGSFKLPAAGGGADKKAAKTSAPKSPKPKKAKPSPKKPKSAPSEAKKQITKAAAAKKSMAPKKTSVKAKTSAVKAKTSPSKSKSPTKAPKAPKPKKTTQKAKAAPKKTAAKKK